jgi:uncharacterized membrane protein
MLLIGVLVLLLVVAVAISETSWMRRARGRFGGLSDRSFGDAVDTMRWSDDWGGGGSSDCGSGGGGDGGGGGSC